MALERIKESDLIGKGVRGQADVPGLTAAEMQEAVEQIVREVCIPKINEIIEKAASKEDLEKLLLEAGAVTSVFGRAGNVKAQKGDYTAEMVGAAAVKHAEEHGVNGKDPIEPESIGAADRNHKHGNIDANGKIGETNGMVLMTGLNGIIEAKAKKDSGFMLPLERKEITGAFTAENGKNYFGDNISDFVFTCDEEKMADCHGWVTFGVPGNISYNGFDYVDDIDEIKTAEAGSRWEFDLSMGCLIIRKRSE